MSRWIGFVIGVLTFLAAHVIEVWKWGTWFGGPYEPWFLNAGAPLAFTMGAVFVVSLAVGWLATQRRVRGVTIAAGSFAAMSAVLFLKPGGAGTIFPIVMAFGGLALLLSSVIGALIGREIRLAVKGR